MNSLTNDLMHIVPQIFVLGMASLILIVDLFVRQEQRNITYWLTQMTLIVAAILTIVLQSGSPVQVFHNMVVDDPLTAVLDLLIYASVFVVLVYSRPYLQVRDLFRGEFFVLVLFSMLGMMIMVAANHFLSLYLGLELMTLSTYALVALNRDSAVSTEAAMKYFILGALSSGLLLYGMSMLYGATGSLEISQVADIIHSGTANHLVLAFGLVFVVAGIAFKLAAVPFHMWVPDVYEGSPTAVTLFIGTAPELAAFGFVARLLLEGLQGLVHDWQGMLIILSVLSLILGNVTAIAQTNIKRMLAYSTISHMGFALLGFLSGTLAGYSSAMLYILIYVMMSLGSFGMVLVLSRAGFEADKIDDFKGLNQKSPWMAFMMLLLMFAMAGVPPTVGFYAKLAVFQAALGAGLTWLVVVAVLMSVVGAFYYLRIVKVMYFDAPVDDTPLTPQADVKLMMSLNGLAMLFFGLMPAPLIHLVAYSIGQSL